MAYYLISNKTVISKAYDSPLKIGKSFDSETGNFIIKDTPDDEFSIWWYKTNQNLVLGSKFCAGKFVTSDPDEVKEVDWHSIVDDCITARVNAVALEFNYSSIEKAISYSTSSIDQYKAEAQQLSDYRDACWLELNNIKKAIKQNLITSAETIKEYLPAKPIKKLIEN